MKLNKFLILTIPFLSACHMPYHGPKVDIKKSDNPGLVEVNATTLKELVKDNKENVAYLISASTCYNCLKVKEKFTSFTTKKQCNIYYTDFDKDISDEEYKLFSEIVDNGTGTTLPPDRNFYVPIFIIFAEGIAAIKADGLDASIDALKYINVVDNLNA